MVAQNDRTKPMLRRSAITSATPDQIVTATLVIQTNGPGFIEFTHEAVRFVTELAAQNGVLMVFLRHTSASLAIQENADADVETDLLMALDRIAPEDAGWVHSVERPDSVPPDVKAM